MRLLLLGLLLLTLSLGVHAQQAAAAQEANEANELSGLLNEFLAGASRNDASVHDRFWAEDVIYTGSGGRRRGKADIMKDVRSAPAPKPGDPVTVFSAADVRIQQYGDTAIVAFRLVGTTTKNADTEVMNYLNSGTFVKRKGKWQVVNWQSTRMPPEETATKQTVATEGASVALPPELARVLTDYEAGWKAGDATALAGLFAEDGFVLAPGRPPVKGRAGIQRAYTHPGSPLSLRSIAYAIQGDVGYIIGGYTQEHGKPDDGKFTLTLRKSDGGRWLIVSDMDNSNRPR
ncbi:MAG TPA: nuclear transport factor 2 family protein [Pyrinomonadaceae bacterium]|jgi:ketosteroid isomerase-like protein|nr:nuclear transport factor 2 family protein [Pyrinomonadaceae bacterium]